MKRKWIVSGIFAALFFVLCLHMNNAYNKKWVGAFLGDSITEQGYYIHALESKYSVKTENFGVSGAMYGDNGSGFACICDEIDMGEWSGNEDFIFVLGGTNDWGNNIALGTKNDTTRDTFYGGGISCTFQFKGTFSYETNLCFYNSSKRLAFGKWGGSTIRD